jgi:hypothetical protein
LSFNAFLEVGLFVRARRRYEGERLVREEVVQVALGGR